MDNSEEDFANIGDMNDLDDLAEFVNQGADQEEDVRDLDLLLPEDQSEGEIEPFSEQDIDSSDTDTDNDSERFSEEEIDSPITDDEDDEDDEDNNQRNARLPPVPQPPGITPGRKPGDLPRRDQRGWRERGDIDNLKRDDVMLIHKDIKRIVKDHDDKELYEAYKRLRTLVSDEYHIIKNNKRQWTPDTYKNFIKLILMGEDDVQRVDVPEDLEQPLEEIRNLVGASIAEVISTIDDQKNRRIYNEIYSKCFIYQLKKIKSLNKDEKTFNDRDIDNVYTGRPQDSPLKFISLLFYSHPRLFNTHILKLSDLPRETDQQHVFEVKMTIDRKWSGANDPKLVKYIKQVPKTCTFVYNIKGRIVWDMKSKKFKINYKSLRERGAVKNASGKGRQACQKYKIPEQLARSCVPRKNRKRFTNQTPVKAKIKRLGDDGNVRYGRRGRRNNNRDQNEDQRSPQNLRELVLAESPQARTRSIQRSPQNLLDIFQSVSPLLRDRDSSEIPSFLQEPLPEQRLRSRSRSRKGDMSTSLKVLKRDGNIEQIDIPKIGKKYIFQDDDLYVAPSTITNDILGLFAAKNLKAGDEYEYNGKIISQSVYTNMTDSQSGYVLELPQKTDRGTTQYVDGNPAKSTQKNPVSKSVFANEPPVDSNGANAELRYKDNNTVWIQLTKDVKKDEEIFVCYGNEYNRSYPVHRDCTIESQMEGINMAAQLVNNADRIGSMAQEGDAEVIADTIEQNTGNKQLANASRNFVRDPSPKNTENLRNETIKELANIPVFSSREADEIMDSLNKLF